MITTSAMELKLFVLEELIDAIPFAGLTLNAAAISHLKQELLQRNEELLSNTDVEPQFAIDSVPSCLNSFTSKFEEVINATAKNKKHKE